LRSSGFAREDSYARVALLGRSVDSEGFLAASEQNLHWQEQKKRSTGGKMRKNQPFDIRGTLRPRNLSFPDYQSKRDSSLRSE